MLLARARWLAENARNLPGRGRPGATPGMSQHQTGQEGIATVFYFSVFCIGTSLLDFA